ncbi:MAG: YciC family protein, partial [Plesiomonas shigelloides]
MPITAQTLLRDSANFIRNHLNTVLLLSLIVAVIVVLAEYLMIGTPDSIELSQDQIMMQSMRTQTLLNILTTPLFSVSLLSLVLLSSRGFQANTMTALKAGVPLYFSMLGL